MLLFFEKPFRFLMDQIGDGEPGGEPTPPKPKGDPKPPKEKGGDPPPGEGDPNDGGGNNTGDEPQDDWTPAQNKAYILKLRKENASYRKRFKTAEDSNASLNTRLGKLENGLKSALGMGDDPNDPNLSSEERLRRHSSTILCFFWMQFL